MIRITRQIDLQTGILNECYTLAIVIKRTPLLKLKCNLHPVFIASGYHLRQAIRKCVQRFLSRYTFGRIHPYPNNFSIESACHFEDDLKVLQRFRFSGGCCLDMIAEPNCWGNEIVFLSKTHGVIYLRS